MWTRPAQHAGGAAGVWVIVGLGGGAPLWPVPPSLWDLNREDRESRFSRNIPAPPPQYKSHSFYQVFRGGEVAEGRRGVPRLQVPSLL